MVLGLILGLIWAAATLAARAVPQRLQWAMAWTLIATGIPLLGYVTVQAGPIPGVVGLVIAVFLLARAIRVTGLFPAPGVRKT